MPIQEPIAEPEIAGDIFHAECNLSDVESHPRIAALLESVEPVKRRLLAHPVYRSIQNFEQLKRFMEAHVFAVWDFMSLLKFLQARLTCTDTPWVPQGEPQVRRMINEIVLGEESDEDGDGGYISHYELYAAGMKQAGADIGPVEDFLKRVANGEPVDEALKASGAPPEAARFVQSTFGFIETGRIEAVAAAFTFGREEVIPDMFRRLVNRLDEQFPGRLTIFRYYLVRHIEVDEGSHGPLSLRMISALCGDDDVKWNAARDAAIKAIESRIQLWDGLCEALK